MLACGNISKSIQAELRLQPAITICAASTDDIADFVDRRAQGLLCTRARPVWCADYPKHLLFLIVPIKKKPPFIQLHGNTDDAITMSCIATGQMPGRACKGPTS